MVKGERKERVVHGETRKGEGNAEWRWNKSNGFRVSAPQVPTVPTKKSRDK